MSDWSICFLYEPRIMEANLIQFVAEFKVTLFEEV